jgi:hypothetical protein
LLIGGSLAPLSSNAVLSWTMPPAGMFRRRHGLVGLISLPAARVLLVALAGPVQARPGQQPTTSSANSSAGRRGEASQSSDMSPPRDSTSDDSGSTSGNNGSTSDEPGPERAITAYAPLHPSTVLHRSEEDR